MNVLTRSSMSPEPAGLLSGQYWGELRIFAEVARARSFNKAAERLGLSQPTIGRKVRRLQDLIGAQLFVSTKQGVRLTQRGEELAAALLLLDHSLHTLASDLKAKAKDAEGIVSLAITDGMAAFFAAPAIPAFSARYPRIQLHLKSMGALNDLRDNRTDMMLTFVPASQPDLVCRRLGSLHFLPIAADSYVARYGLPTRERLADHLFLQSYLYETSAPQWRDWQALCAAGRIAHYCDNSFAYGMMVKQGLGIGLLGTYATRDSAAIPLELGVRCSLPLYGVALAERLDARPVRIVFDWLCDCFGPANPWFSPTLNLSDLPTSLPALAQLLSD
jgi:DNA-binding transcriptional LysR family regulator